MKYTKNDTNPMNYVEFGHVMELLLEKIIDSGITFDAVAPILRNGAIPGTIIANRLQIIRMLPIQVKCDYEHGDARQLLPFCLPIDNSLGTSPNILLVDTNTYSGGSAKLSYSIVQKVVPGANLYYATVGRVFRKPQVELSFFKDYYWGVMTNEAFEATAKEVQELELRPKITIYPWETVEFELEEINK